jgi:hypothetical protein
MIEFNSTLFSIGSFIESVPAKVNEPVPSGNREHSATNDDAQGRHWEKMLQLVTSQDVEGRRRPQ